MTLVLVLTSASRVCWLISPAGLGRPAGVSQCEDALASQFAGATCRRSFTHKYPKAIRDTERLLSVSTTTERWPLLLTSLRFLRYNASGPRTTSGCCMTFKLQRASPTEET